MADFPPVVATLLDAATADDKHARTALRAYASSVRPEDPRLAQYIIHFLNDLPRMR